MIVCTTNCKDCEHEKVCRYTNFAENDALKLKNTTYIAEPNSDYNWNDMSTSRNICINFSCKNFKKKAFVGVRTNDGIASIPDNFV